MSEQLSIFSEMFENYKIKKPIRLIELFAGYGSQALALKYLDANFEHYKICEWATKSIQAYNDIHIKDYTDYSKDFTRDEIINKLFDYGISLNYNEPMTLEQIKRKDEQWQRTTYNNIIATHNLVNVAKVKGSDLKIVDTDKYDYIMTYSFPCQDLSLAGKGKGMKKDSGTRSGMLWEVERILDELEEKPQILLMENVPQVIGTNSIKDFQDWELKLESLGYSNYVEVLNAKDFGMPQNRERCFMISILGEYNYTFPQKEKLKLRLKDLLEDKVDEKFYLSDKQINQIMYWNSQQEPFETLDKEICPILTTRSGAYAGGMVLTSENEEKDLGKKLMNLKTQLCNELVKSGKVKEMVVVYDDYNSSIRKDQDTIGTITTNIGNNAPRNGYKIIENIIKIGNYSPSGHNAASVVDSNGISPTVMENHGAITAIIEKPQYSDYSMKKIVNNIVKDDIIGTITANAMQSINHDNCHLVIDNTPKLVGGLGEMKSNAGTQFYQQDRIYDGNGIAMCHPANIPGGSYMYQLGDLRIRKLTPKECFRLMGVKDEDYENVAKNQSNASLYHLAGDSIVANVLMAIFKNIL